MRIYHVANNGLTDSQIVESNKTRGELTVQEVVRLIDRAHARVGIIVGVHAKAERLVIPERRRSPVSVVVTARIR